MEWPSGRWGWRDGLPVAEAACRLRSSPPGDREGEEKSENSGKAIEKDSKR